MNEWKAQLVLDVKNQLGEGPCWDDRNNTLYWLDIFSKKIFSMQDGDVVYLDTPYMIGTLALTDNENKLLLAGEKGIYELSINEKKFNRICDPEEGISGRRFNDGKVGPDGRFWVGGVCLQGQEAAGPCKFYCIDKDFSSKVILDNVRVSNGLAWTADKKTMYYIDSPTQQIWAFDFDENNKKLTNKRVVVTIEKEQGEPDGMTIDTDGMLWVAMWEGWCVKRFDPATGKEIGRISVDAPLVSCPIFGGEDMGTLYITTASSTAFSKEARSEFEGGMFSVRTGSYGVPSYKFK